MSLSVYFAGFTSCTDNEMYTARALQILLNLAAFVLIYFAVKKILRLNIAIARYTLLIIVPILIYACFVIFYIILGLLVIGLCTNSPALWQL